MSIRNSGLPGHSNDELPMTTPESKAAKLLKLREKWDEIESFAWSDDEGCITPELVKALQEFGKEFTDYAG